MKSQSPHLVIVSCYQKDLPEVGNVKNHFDLVNQLNLLSVPYIECEGVYDGVKEKSLIFAGQYKRVAEMICREYNQVCYLEHHNDRSCELIYSNGVKTKLGIMKEVTIKETEGKDHTYVPSTGRYFIVE